MLDALIPSKARTVLLREFLLGRDSRRYLRELVYKTGLAQGSVQHELANLVKAGVLARQAEGRQVYYTANQSCPILPELRSIMAKTTGAADTLKEALLPESENIKSALVFGSFASGDVRPESDIDLLVVGSITPRRVSALLRDVSLSRPINPVVMTEDEFVSLRESDDHFLNRVLAGPNVVLMGDVDEPQRPA